MVPFVMRQPASQSVAFPFDSLTFRFRQGFVRLHASAELHELAVRLSETSVFAAQPFDIAPVQLTLDGKFAHPNRNRHTT